MVRVVNVRHDYVSVPPNLLGDLHLVHEVLRPPEDEDEGGSEARQEVGVSVGLADDLSVLRVGGVGVDQDEEEWETERMHGIGKVYYPNIFPKSDGSHLLGKSQEQWACMDKFRCLHHSVTRFNLPRKKHAATQTIEITNHIDYYD